MLSVTLFVNNVVASSTFPRLQAGLVHVEQAGQETDQQEEEVYQEINDIEEDLDELF